MARFVIDAGTTLHLAKASIAVPSARELYAPTLWRSQTLAAVYEAVQRGDLTTDAAREQLGYINGLKIRLLGDAVLRRRAWEIAEQLGMATTYDAEYIALAQLQKCTLVSTDNALLTQVGDLVPTANVNVLR